MVGKVVWECPPRHEDEKSAYERTRRNFHGDAEDTLKQILHDPVEDPDAVRRMDLTKLPNWAIDSNCTTEVDDGISWDGEKGKVWVHIADPTRYFPEGRQNALLSAVICRGSTVYLPSGHIPMFPQNLVKEVLSLDACNHDGTALSFGFKVIENATETVDVGALSECSVVLSKVQAPNRLTYEAADSIIQGNRNRDGTHDLLVLWKLACLRRKYRTDAGAFMHEHCDGFVKVEELDSIGYTIEAGAKCGSDLAQVLVQEMMISANETAARFGDRNLIPMIFQTQSRMSEGDYDEVQSVPAGPAQKHQAIWFGKPVKRETVAKVHSNLGVEKYAQVTSPIRRAFDLVNHLQLKAFLRTGSNQCTTSCYDRSSLESVLPVLRKAYGDVRTKQNEQEWLWRARFINLVHRQRFRKSGDDAFYAAVLCRRVDEEEDRDLFRRWMDEGSYIGMLYSVEPAVRTRSRCALSVVFVKELGVEVGMLIPRTYK